MTTTPTGGNGTRALQIATDLYLAIAEASASRDPELTRLVMLGVKAAREHARHLGIADEVKAAARKHFRLNLTAFGWDL